MIHIRTPYRVSLVGGGTDFKEWYNKNDGGVIAFSIDKYIHLFLRELPKIYNYNYRIRYVINEEVNSVEKIKHKVVRELIKKENINMKLDITYIGEFPARSGLGSSSAFTVSMINGLNFLVRQNTLKNQELAKRAIHFEQDILNEKVGSQDQIITSYGGLKKIIFRRNDKFICKKISLKKSLEEKLNNSFVLVWTGISRIADQIERKKFSNFNDKKIILKEIFGLVGETEKCFYNKKNLIKNLGTILNEQWTLKKRIDPIVSNYKIDKIYDSAIKFGAIGGKLLGAGAGGFFLFLVEEDNRKFFFKKMSRFYIQKINISNEGSLIL